MRTLYFLRRHAHRAENYYVFGTEYFRRLLRFTAWIAIAIRHSRHPRCKTLQTFGKKFLNVPNT